MTYLVRRGLMYAARQHMSPPRSTPSSNADNSCAASVRALRASPRRTRRVISRASTPTIVGPWAPRSSAIPQKCASCVDRAETLHGVAVGEIDVLLRNSTQTYLRAVSIGLRIGPVNFYDGQGFVVKRDAKVDKVAGLNGATVCVAQGTTHEVTLGDYARRAQYHLVAGGVRTRRHNVPGVLLRPLRCHDAGRLRARRRVATAAPNPADYQVLSETISKEPLGRSRATVTKPGRISLPGCTMVWSRPRSSA